MTTLTAPHPPRLPPGWQDRAIAMAATLLAAMILLALTRQLMSGRPSLAAERSIWLTIHLLSVIPAVPLGGYVLFRRKGD